jgi:porcupine-like protein
VKAVNAGFVAGAQMVLSMKMISLAFDFGAGVIIDLPSIMQFMGYCCHVGTVVFGPWVSYEDYSRSLLTEKLPLVGLTHCFLYLVLLLQSKPEPAGCMCAKSAF